MDSYYDNNYTRENYNNDSTVNSVHRKHNESLIERPSVMSTNRPENEESLMQN